jgi:hypothetical protein
MGAVRVIVIRNVAPVNKILKRDDTVSGLGKIAHRTYAGVEERYGYTFARIVYALRRYRGRGMNRAHTGDFRYLRVVGFGDFYHVIAQVGQTVFNAANLGYY